MKALVRVSLVLLLIGCGDATLVGPSEDISEADLHRTHGHGFPHAISVLDWNIYIGTNVDAVIVALATPDPTDDLAALQTAVETLIATDFPTRAQAIVREIERRRPHVVALQEVSTIAIDLTGLGLPVTIDLDFLVILQATLAAHGLHYDVGASVTNVVANPIPGISVVDYDVMLVDTDRVTVTSVIAENYVNNVGPVTAGVSLIRGYAGVEATIHGESYLFLGTHLEPDLDGDLSLLRAAQAAELAAAIGSAERVVVMGDFNDVTSSPMYQTMTAAGFTDVWADVHHHAPGLTCCHLPDLSDRHPPFTQRIDYVFARGLGSRHGVHGQIERLGAIRSQRIRGPGLPNWPSDHAGLAARLLTPHVGDWIAATRR